MCRATTDSSTSTITLGIGIQRRHDCGSILGVHSVTDTFSRTDSGTVTPRNALLGYYWRTISGTPFTDRLGTRRRRACTPSLWGQPLILVLQDKRGLGSCSSTQHAIATTTIRLFDCSPTDPRSFSLDITASAFYRRRRRFKPRRS